MPVKLVSGWSRSRRIWTQVPVVGSHNRIALSHPELASRLPSGRHATPYTTQRWPRNTLDSFLPPLPATFQRLTTVSAPALASRVPFGLQTPPLISSLYDSRFSGG